MKIPMAQSSSCSTEDDQKPSSCCPDRSAQLSSTCCPSESTPGIRGIVGGESLEEVCCGGPPPPKSNPFERAGYTLCHYVHSFLQAENEQIPLVRTKLEAMDHLGTVLARLGLNRNNYKVAPGLYGVGEPEKDSPVIATANYKLTFDMVRKELEGLDAWLLVLDTCGINVWCAAGKGTFSTSEIVERIERTGLANKINHRQLIVPQLGATGVGAHRVKKQTGFKVVYGPIRASDLPSFIARNECDATMRLVTFTVKERLELIPVEFYLFSKKIWWIFPLLFLLSGVGPWFYSLNMVWERGWVAAFSLLIGGISGAVAVPLLLPWIPGRALSFKGLLCGLLSSLIFLGVLGGAVGGLEKVALIFSITSVSSYLAMNFTGSTPYTSPSGVEREMKKAIPLQLGFLTGGLLLWIAAPFFM